LKYKLRRKDKGYKKKKKKKKKNKGECKEKLMKKGKETDKRR